MKTKFNKSENGKMKPTAAVLVLLVAVVTQSGHAGEGSTATKIDAGQKANLKGHQIFIPPKVTPLTLGECIRLGGAITVDTSCPETYSTNSAYGGKITGNFKCRGQGQDASQGICVNESG
ncbi:MAG: hypothetical protein E6K53_12515 [Gammaproteobacteria bacterium]|nr:MAG: hypothetical protein E6K53_12515 [Gammaproteobacteria bacterium]